MTLCPAGARLRIGLLATVTNAMKVVDNWVRQVRDMMGQASTGRGIEVKVHVNTSSGESDFGGIGFRNQGTRKQSRGGIDGWETQQAHSEHDQSAIGSRLLTA